MTAERSSEGLATPWPFESRWIACATGPTRSSAHSSCCLPASNGAETCRSATVASLRSGMRIDPRKRCWPSRARAMGPRGSVSPTRTRVSQSSAARRAEVDVPVAAKNSSVAASNNKLSERATTRSNVESGSSTRAACLVCAAHPASMASASGASHCADGADLGSELFLLREEAFARVDRGRRILTTAV